MRDIMFIWKYIDIPIDLVEEIKQEYKLGMTKNEFFLQDVNIKMKKFMGLEIESPALIQVRPNFLKHLNIHTDEYNTSTINQPMLAINIPLENCENSTTAFWKSNKKPIRKSTPNSFTYDQYFSKHCEKIDEFKLTQPVIFNTQIPHSVINPTNKWRRAISLRFIEDPWHLTKL